MIDSRPLNRIKKQVLGKGNRTDVGEICDMQMTMDDVNANEFLTIKSTEQQIKEGVERPVDTAFVEEQNGELILKAVFDVHHFKPEEVTLTVCFTYFAFCCEWLQNNAINPREMLNYLQFSVADV